ncbi:MAG: hypothetical protein LUE86_02615, partial [Clostridiales bacterium]|nr:hypothetical protein [Clostridiales bacterium]
ELENIVSEDSEAETEESTEEVQVAVTEYASETAEEASTENVAQVSQAVAVDLSGEGSKKFIGYTLEKTGEIESQQGMTVLSNYIKINKDNAFQLVSGKGEILTDSYYDVSYLGNGFFAVRNSDTELNSKGLIDENGEQLIPCEAADIEWMRSIFSTNDFSEENRYLKVTYALEKTEDKDEAFLFVTDRMIAISPDEDDTLYTGYATIYDTKEHQFVSNIKMTNNEGEVSGDNLMITDDDGMSYLYDANGNILMKTDKYWSSNAGKGYVITHDAGSYEVYDEKGSLAFSSAKMLARVVSTSRFLERAEEGGGFSLLDMEGNMVLPGAYETIREIYGMVQVRLKDNTYQLTDLNGTVIASSDNEFNMLEPGYYYSKCADDTYMLVGPEGIIMEDLEQYPNKACVVDGTKALVLSEKEFSLQLDGDKITQLSTGIIAVQSDSSGKVGVFDLFTGKKLLDYMYSEIKGGDDYLFARLGDTWEIYKINRESR